MKKMFTIIVALICISMLIMLTACDNDVENHNSSSEELSVTPIPVTQNSSYEAYVSTNKLKTEEGIEIVCSDNYVMGHEGGGQFSFHLSNKEYESEEFLTNDAYDWKVEFTSSNAEIVKVDFYFEGNLIGSEECENNTAIVDQDYNNKYCDKCVLYIMHKGNLYSAEFFRGGL